MQSLEGFLMKQGEGGLKTWKRRWFSLKQGNGVPGRRPHLYYYDKKDEANVKGKIDLTEVISVTRTTADLMGKGEKGGYEFNITIPRRVYKLRAASEADLMRWVEGLRDVQSRAPPAELLGTDEGGEPGDKRLSFRHSMKSKFKRMTGIEDESGGFRQPNQRQTVDLSQLNLSLRSEEVQKSAPPASETVSPRVGSPSHDSPQQSKSAKPNTLDKMGGAIEEVASRGAEARSSTVTGGEAPKPRTTMTDVGMAQSTGDLSNLDLSYITNDVSSSPKAVVRTQPSAVTEEEQKKDDQSSLPKVTIDAWMTDNEDREVYTLRKKLAEALGTIDEKQSEIRHLQQSLDKCHKELEAVSVARESEAAIDHDKKRREAELSALNDKLEVERRQRREMEARYTEVKAELALLKKNLHLMSNVPSLVPEGAAPPPEEVPPSSPVRPRVQITEPPARTTEPVRSLEANARPALKRDSVLQKSMSMSSMAAVRNPTAQKRAPWMEDYLVKACPLCNKEFGLFNRRHHCRNCGNIYCGPCSMYKCRVPGYKRPERVCDQCAHAIRSARGGGGGGGGGGAPRARPKSTYLSSPQAAPGQSATSQRRNSDMVSAYDGEPQRWPQQQQWQQQQQQQQMGAPMLRSSSGEVEVLSFD